MKKDSPPPNRNEPASVWRVPLEGARLTHAQFLELAWGYAHDCTVEETAAQCGLSSKTVAKYYAELRRRTLGRPATTRAPSEADRHRQMEIAIFHDRRRAQHRGWRYDREEEHLAESRIRYGLYEMGSVLFQRIIGDLYD